MSSPDFMRAVYELWREDTGHAVEDFYRREERIPSLQDLLENWWREGDLCVEEQLVAEWLTERISY